jgi:uncharacterized protein (TIGR02271 family)
MNLSHIAKGAQVAIPPDHRKPDDLIVPLYEEQLSVVKNRIVTGRVQVSAVTREHEHVVDELLAREQVEVDRVPIGKVIDTMPDVHEVGDTIIIPVVEEILVVQRRLLLKEEVHIRRVRGTERHQELVMLHKQEAVVTRVPLEESAAESTPANDRNESG